MQNEPQEKKPAEAEAGVSFTSEENIKKTRVTMCAPDAHRWRKFSDTEIACEICPTINIVENTNDYV